MKLNDRGGDIYEQDGGRRGDLDPLVSAQLLHAGSHIVKFLHGYCCYCFEKAC